jgi:hypothetical protein
MVFFAVSFSSPFASGAFHQLNMIALSYFFFRVVFALSEMASRDFILRKLKF